MESMPIILLFWIISFRNCDIKELKQIENYENKIFLDEDDDFTWENICRRCESFDCSGCCEEREDN